MNSLSHAAVSTSIYRYRLSLSVYFSRVASNHIITIISQTCFQRSPNNYFNIFEIVALMVFHKTIKSISVKQPQLIRLPAFPKSPKLHAIQQVGRKNNNRTWLSCTILYIYSIYLFCIQYVYTPFPPNQKTQIYLIEWWGGVCSDVASSFGM